MIMALFRSDFEALIFLAIIIACILFINWFIPLTISRISKIQEKYKVFINFFTKVISIIIILLFILEGFPMVASIDPTYLAVLTTSISTALAFAMSGIFSNLVSGITLLILSPFDIGDIIKIGGNVGVVRNLKLTRTTIETFDNVIINKSNNEILSSNITNYSINLENIKKFTDFKKEIQIDDATSQDSKEYNIRSMFNSVVGQFKTQKIHNFVFTMQFPYKGFQHIKEQIDKIAEKYKDVFGIKPMYHIFSFELKIHVRFRILTDNPEILFDHQPKFVEEISKSI